MGESEGSVAKSPASLVGQVVAEKYRVVKLLDAGGFGEIYLVESIQEPVGEKLELRVLPRELSADGTFREQFLHEIRLAMRIVDKYVAEIRDVGSTDDDVLYYAMAHSPGMSLTDLLAQTARLPIEQAIKLCMKVLKALTAIHDGGIVHRDLTPRSIRILERAGKKSVRLVDFGLAHGGAINTGPALEAEDDTDRAPVGHPGYMAPEALAGHAVGFTADLYSVGVILYEAITGGKPFPGPTLATVIEQVKEGPAPPESIVPAMFEYPGLCALIRKAMSKNPDGRFESARAFYEALKGLTRLESAAATKKRPNRRDAQAVRPLRPPIRKKPPASPPSPPRQGQPVEPRVARRRGDVQSRWRERGSGRRLALLTASVVLLVIGAFVTVPLLRSMGVLESAPPVTEPAAVVADPQRPPQPDTPGETPDPAPAAAVTSTPRNEPVGATLPGETGVVLSPAAAPDASRPQTPPTLQRRNGDREEEASPAQDVPAAEVDDVDESSPEPEDDAPESELESEVENAD